MKETWKSTPSIEKDRKGYRAIAVILFAINDEGICDAKLFSFREWQKYIECRRAVLINVHCPTKLKYNANIPDVNSLYIKFLEFISTKTDREEPEKITHKHVIPHELVYAMKQCITNVSCINLPLNEVNEFSPTLTPYHSYLQQLLEHPLYDSPRMLRNDFSSVKSGYLTRPESTCKLTSQYDMQLELVDSNLHFIEKIVSLFEQAKMVSVKDLKDDVVIQDFMEEDMEEECDNRKEDFTDYLHKKIPCQLKIDMKKKQNCNHIHNTITDMQTPSVSASANEFAFDQILPDGKLSIPDRCLNDDNDGDDDDDNACLKDIVSEQTRLLLSKFCKVYNIDLSRTEKRKIFKNFNWSKKRKRKLLRNAHGKFIKRSDIYSSIESPNEDDYEESYAEETEESIGILANTFEIENIPEISRDILNSSEVNASIFDTVVEIESECGMNDKSDKFCKIFESMIDKSFTTDRTLDDNILKLFRPFKDYWMYHCNFSRVKPKNFELLEKMLPRSFRWLLNECANIIEMSTEDLYEEVCLVEAYYAYALEQSKIHAINVTNKTENCNRQAHINIILSKW